MNIWIILYPFLFGSLMTIYDEIIDNKIEINIFLLYLIQLCLFLFAFITCNQDIICLIYFSFLSTMYLLNIIFNFLLYNPIDTYFFIICSFFCIGLFIKNINKINIKYIIINIFLLILTIIESYVYHEEYSYFKLISRTYGLIYLLFIVCLFFLNIIDNIFIFIVFFGIGQCLMWLISKQYFTNKYVNLLNLHNYIWKKIKKTRKKLKKQENKYKIRFV